MKYEEALSFVEKHEESDNQYVDLICERLLDGDEHIRMLNTLIMIVKAKNFYKEFKAARLLKKNPLVEHFGKDTPQIYNLGTKFGVGKFAKYNPYKKYINSEYSEPEQCHNNSVGFANEIGKDCEVVTGLMDPCNTGGGLLHSFVL
ncbi:MAG: hypothetical protein FWC00_05475 [Firmicutes bacterium]|nr:hypothetical protein [Bacillota bacterium]